MVVGFEDDGITVVVKMVKIGSEINCFDRCGGEENN